METLDQSPGLPSWAADDPQLWHAIVTGDNEQVRDLGLAMARDDPLNAPALYERAAIGAGRLGDLAALDVVVAEFDALGRQGRTMAATRAFIAALCTGADPSAERAARSAVFRAAATAWRELECHFTVAMVQLEATRVLGPVTSEGREASAEARRIFDQLGAVPFLAQLDAFEAPIRA